MTDIETSCLLLGQKQESEGGAKECPANSVGRYGSVPCSKPEIAVKVGSFSSGGSPYRQHHRDISRESGFDTDRGRRSFSVSSFSSDDLEASTSWESQEEEVFRYMQKNTSQVESELKKILMAESEEKEDGDVEIDMTSTILSINADQDDYTMITIQSEFVSVEDDRKRYKSAFGVLCNLKQEITRLSGYLDCECSRLRRMIMVDGHAATSEDVERLIGLSERQEKFKSCLDGNLALVLEQIDCIRHKNEVIIDGVRSRRYNRRFSENPITKLIRKSPINCVTWFHGVLFAILLAMICYMYLWSKASDEWTVYLRLIRSPLLILLLLYLYGINMKVWAMFKIDYVTVFDHPPDATPTPKYIFKMASTLTVLMALLGVCVIVSSSFSSKLPIKIIPMVMWLVLFAFLLNPLNIFLRKVRFSFARTFFRVILAPLFFVYFADFFLADQFNSSVTIFLDIQYLVCYIISHPWTGKVDPGKCTSSSNGVRPILTGLPALWRFFQCLRCYYDTRNVKHLVNAGKYFSTFPVVIFATIFSVKVKGNILTNFDFEDAGWILICWIVASAVHGLYTFAWDVCCDWGLWNFRCTLFTRKLVYKHKIVYVVAIFLDFVLRCLWTLKLTLAIVWEVDSDLIFTGLVVAEMLRRFIWNFFRVEFAHVLSEK